MDVRAYTTTQYASDPNGVFGQYLALVQSSAAAWRAANGPGDFVVVAPAWYSLQYYTDSHNVQHSFLEWVALYADVVSVVDSFDNAADLVHWANPICNFANNQGHRCNIIVDTSSQQAVSTTFANDGRQQMQRELISVEQSMIASVGDAWAGSRVIDSANFIALGNSAGGLAYTSGTARVGVYVTVAPEGLTSQYITNLWNLFGSVDPAYTITEIIYPYTEQQLLGSSGFAALFSQAATRNATVQLVVGSNDWTFTSQHNNAANTINAIVQLMNSVRGLDSGSQPTSGPTTIATNAPPTTTGTPTTAATTGPTATGTTVAPTTTTGPSSTATATTALPGATTAAPTGTSTLPPNDAQSGASPLTVTAAAPVGLALFAVALGVAYLAL